MILQYLYFLEIRLETEFECTVRPHCLILLPTSFGAKLLGIYFDFLGYLRIKECSVLLITI